LALSFLNFSNIEQKIFDYKNAQSYNLRASYPNCFSEDGRKMKKRV
jgi:hypothetical protein